MRQRIHCCILFCLKHHTGGNKIEFLTSAVTGPRQPSYKSSIVTSCRVLEQVLGILNSQCCVPYSFQVCMLYICVCKPLSKAAITASARVFFASHLVESLRRQS